MATWVGIGNSRQSDSYRAGQEAVTKAFESMGQPYPDLVLVFASVRFDQEALLEGVRSVALDAQTVGCSTAGEILTEGPVRRSVAVMAIRSDSLRIAAGIGLRMSDDSRRAGQEVATQVVRAKLTAPHGFLMFPDGISGNAAEVIRGAQDVLGLSFPIVGGSAADDFGFRRTYQYFQGKVYTNTVPGILLAGPIAVGVGAHHGWQPLGKPKRVTRSFGNVVQEVEGQAAAMLYEGYFGKKDASLKTEELAKISIMYPLGFPVPGEEEYLLRNALKINPDGTLVFSGEVPEGTEVRLMMGSKAKALEAARRAAEQAVLNIAPRPPRLALIFSCVSRGQLLGQRAQEEISIIRSVLGEHVPFVGFYDYGEQAPMNAVDFRGRSYSHNESIVVVTVAAP